MSKVCVFVFFASVALSAVLEAKGIETHGAFGLVIFFSGIGSISLLTQMTTTLLSPLVNKMFGKAPAKANKQRRATAR